MLWDLRTTRLHPGAEHNPSAPVRNRRRNVRTVGGDALGHAGVDCAPVDRVAL